jgi:hypothetical protein
MPWVRALLMSKARAKLVPMPEYPMPPAFPPIAFVPAFCQTMAKPSEPKSPAFCV